MSRQRLPALDGLRGIAAVIVVVYHTLRLDPGFRHGIFHFRPDDFKSWLLTVTPLRALFDGHLAVWVFFALSGFVLSRRHWAGRRTTWRAFYARRAVRLYVPVIGSAVGAVALLGARQEFLDTGKGLVDLGAAGTSVSQLIHNMALVSLVDAPLNGVWWSMRWEVWFSLLVLPMLAVLGWIGCGARRRHRWAPAAFGCVCILTVTMVPTLRRMTGVATPWNQALLYLPMFGVGVAVAAYEQEIRTARWLRRSYWGWVSLVGCLLALGATGPLGALRVGGHLSAELATGVSNGLGVLGAGALVGLFVGWRSGVIALSSRPLAWVGARSYSLYLVHLPLLHVLTAMLEMDTAPVWFIALVVVASLAYCTVFYRFVEAPSIRLAARIGGRRGDRSRAENRAESSTGIPEPVGVG